MDIIYRLRVIFWFLVVLIWGIYLYQYISEDLESSKNQKIILNKSTKTESIILQKKNDTTYYQPQTVIITTQIYRENTEGKKENKNERMLVKSEGISLPQEIYKEERIESEIEKNIGIKKAPKIPDGFNFKETRHFYIYAEKDIDINEIESKLETLHGEMMLDLIAFSPWTRDEKVSIYLASTAQKYQEISKRPPWSGGAANLREKKIYLYKSDEWFGILAHELTHIYFDSFFGDYDKSPLWLSEGMAVYIQVERGGSHPLWLKENLSKIKEGSGYNLSDLTRIKTLEDADDKSVKLWYAESYSLVFFLLKIQRGDNFYQFCKRIKEGQKISTALFHAYGKPYTTLAALESVWRMDVRTGNITGMRE